MDRKEMMAHFTDLVRPIFPSKLNYQSNAKEGEDGFIEVEVGKSKYRIQFAGKALDSYKNSAPEKQKESDGKLKKIVQSGFRAGDTEIKFDQL